MQTLLLDGRLTAVSPIAIILPGSEDNRVPAGAPRKRMLRDGVVTETIYVPPSSLRGRLRHLLTTEVMRLQHAHDGRVFTPEDYIDVALGGVKDRKSGNDDDRRIDLKAIRALRKANPIVSLFGSMVSQVSGRLMVGDLTPVEPIAPTNTGRSVRANPFVRNPAILELLDPQRFDEFTQRNAMRIEAKQAEGAAKRLKRDVARMKHEGVTQAEVEGKEAELKALTDKAKDAGVNIQQPLDGYDVIPEGTEMSNRIRLIDGTDAELVLVLLALHLLALRPLLGGHLAHGCGEIAGAWQARLRDGTALLDVGTLRIRPYEGLALEAATPLLTQAYARALGFAKEVQNYTFKAA